MPFIWVRHHFYFKWPSEPREGLAVGRAKAVPSFLSYSKTLSIGLARKLNLRPLALQSSTLPTELILPRLIKPTQINVRHQWAIHQGWNEYNVYLWQSSVSEELYPRHRATNVVPFSWCMHLWPDSIDSCWANREVLPCCWLQIMQLSSSGWKKEARWRFEFHAV